MDRRKAVEGDDSKRKTLVYPDAKTGEPGFGGLKQVEGITYGACLGRSRGYYIRRRWQTPRDEQ